MDINFSSFKSSSFVEKYIRSIFSKHSIKILICSITECLSRTTFMMEIFLCEIEKTINQMENDNTLLILTLYSYSERCDNIFQYYNCLLYLTFK
jgi:hypothetical protein